MTDFLIVVDMQRDFITGALGTAEAQAITPAVAARIARAKDEGTQVIFTLDTHEDDYMTTQEGRRLPVPHCIRGTEGWALDPQIAGQCARGMLSFEKPTFGSQRLSAYLSEQALLRGSAFGAGIAIELCGVCTDICVVSNVLLIKAALPEAELSVNPALCAGVTPQSHEAAIKTMASCQIDIL